MLFRSAPVVLGVDNLIFRAQSDLPKEEPKGRQQDCSEIQTCLLPSSIGNMKLPLAALALISPLCLAEPEPAYSPFFPRLEKEVLNEIQLQQASSSVERETFIDDCSKYTDCGSCVSASSLFVPCRWCPKFGDVSCHQVGSLSNSCESDEQVRACDRCCQVLHCFQRPKS